MSSTGSRFAASLLILMALGGCGTSVTVVHTIPPTYSIVPAKTVLVFAGSPREYGGALYERFLESLRRTHVYDVIGARAFEPPFVIDHSLAEWREGDPVSFQSFRRDHPADVIARVEGPYPGIEHTCTAEETGEHTYRVACAVGLELLDAKDGHLIADAFSVVGNGEDAKGSDAWDEAMDDAVWELVHTFTPRRTEEHIDIDDKAPLAKEGIARIDHHNLSGARALWEESLAKFSGSAPFLYNLGAVCEALRDREAARKYYTEAASLAPEEPRYQQALSLLQSRSEDEEAAQTAEPIDPAAAKENAEEEAKAEAAAAAELATRKIDEEKTQAARARSILIAGSSLVEQKSAETFVLIPKGRFMMGCTTGDAQCTKEEKPAHEVTITRSFYTATTPTTNAQYQRCVDTRVCKGKADLKKAAYPVVNVTWNDAEAFCAWIGGRLPTEAEWEYAARGATQAIDRPPPFSTGSTINPNQANYDGNFIYGAGAKMGIYRQKTLEVGSFKPNAFGLYDMHGNVWEWVEDWYNGKLFPDPVPPATGTVHVLKGASFLGDVKNLTYTTHGAGPANGWDVGVRVVREVR